jgi:hypothetical protein
MAVAFSYSANLELAVAAIAGAVVAAVGFLLFW